MILPVRVIPLLALLVPASIRAQASLELAPVWVRVADSFGAVDDESGRASTESAEFSPDDSLIVSGSKAGWEVTVRRVGDGTAVWTQKHQEEVEAVTFSPDGKLVASAGEDRVARIWTASDGGPIQTLQHAGSIEGLRFTHSGEFLLTGDETGTLSVWRSSDWTLAASVQVGPDEDAGGPSGAHSDINQIDVSANDSIVVSASRNLGVDVWNLQSDGQLEHIRTLEGHTGSIKCVRLSPDGALVAAGAGSASGVRIWSLESGEEIAHIEATAMIMETVAFTNDGRFLLTGGNEGEGAIGAPVENPGFENNDGFGHIRYYRVPETQGDPFEPAGEYAVFRQEYLDISGGGTQLVSAHEDGTVRLWELAETNTTAAESIRLAVTPFRLQSIYPNPFEHITRIEFALDHRASVSAAVYDLLGREVLRIPPRSFAAGSHAIAIIQPDLPAGTYVFQLRAETSSAIQFRSGTVTVIR